MVAYTVGSSIGDKLYDVGKKIRSTAKTITKLIYTGIKNTAKKARSVIKKIFAR